jgi:hypothetical protein
MLFAPPLRRPRSSSVSALGGEPGRVGRSLDHSLNAGTRMVTAGHRSAITRRRALFLSDSKTSQRPTAPTRSQPSRGLTCMN